MTREYRFSRKWSLLLAGFFLFAGSVRLSSQSGFEDDLEQNGGIKKIGFTFEFLQIRPTETIEMERFSSPKKVVNGEVCRFLAQIRDPISNVSILDTTIEVTPHIIENEGVEMVIRLRISSYFGSEKWFTRKVTVGNYESAVVEFLRSAVDQVKFALKITPVVETVPVVKAFADLRYKVDLHGQFLILNRKEVLITGAPVAKGNAGDTILVFAHRERGLFVVSFVPFPGAEPLGVCTGNLIRFKYRNDLFEWTFARPLLPDGKWHVWVRHNPAFNSGDANTRALLGNAGVPYATVFSGRDTWKNFFPKNTP